MATLSCPTSAILSSTGPTSVTLRTVTSFFACTSGRDGRASARVSSPAFPSTAPYPPHLSSFTTHPHTRDRFRVRHAPCSDGGSWWGRRNAPLRMTREGPLCRSHSLVQHLLPFVRPPLRRPLERLSHPRVACNTAHARAQCSRPWSQPADPTRMLQQQRKHGPSQRDCLGTKPHPCPPPPRALFPPSPLRPPLHPLRPFSAQRSHACMFHPMTEEGGRGERPGACWRLCTHMGIPSCRARPAQESEVVRPLRPRSDHQGHRLRTG
jgi:hypothetical protein